MVPHKIKSVISGLLAVGILHSSPFVSTAHYESQHPSIISFANATEILEDSVMIGSHYDNSMFCLHDFDCGHTSIWPTAEDMLESGTLHIALNPTINVPESFSAQDIHITLSYGEVDDNENSLTFSTPLVGVSLTFSNWYETTLDLPVGEYYIYEGSVAYNYYGDMVIQKGEKFEIKHNETTTLPIYFDTVNMFTHESILGDLDSCGVLEIAYQNALEHETIQILLKQNGVGESQYELNASNNYQIQEDIPIGTYSITSITSNIHGVMNSDINLFALSTDNTVSIEVQLPSIDDLNNDGTESTNNSNLLSWVFMIVFAIFCVLLVVFLYLLKEKVAVK